jgi:hypothetical protein
LVDLPTCVFEWKQANPDAIVSVKDVSKVLSTRGGSSYWRRARQEELSEMGAVVLSLSQLPRLEL